MRTTHYPTDPFTVRLDPIMVSLDKTEFGIEQRIADTILVHPRWEQIRDHEMQSMVVRLKAGIWTEKAQRVEVRYPSDWWQAVKERFSPAWCKRRWPVRYAVKMICADFLYPSLPQNVPDHIYTLRIYIRE